MHMIVEMSGKFLLRIISFPVFSIIWYHISRIKKPRWLAEVMISVFKNFYKVDMGRFKGDVSDYSSLNDFFTRSLSKEKYPDNSCDDKIFFSPADGYLTGVEHVLSDKVKQIKGHSYRLSELLNRQIDFSSGWYVLTIYLSPSDYHRFHVPVNCSAEELCRTGGWLYPVNKFSVNNVNNLFVKNERVVISMNTFGKTFFFTAVGAALVGTVDINIAPEKTVSPGNWSSAPRELKRMDELGKFEMGSTIIIVLPETVVKELYVSEGSAISTGTAVLKLKGNKDA